MARPRKCRKVCRLPKSKEFGVLNKDMNQSETIVLAVDEYESIRLIDLEQLTQVECAERMQVARTTVTSIYGHARMKLAEALVTGKKILIQGGDYVLCDHSNKGCPNCHKENSGLYYNMNKEISL